MRIDGREEPSAIGKHQGDRAGDVHAVGRRAGAKLPLDRNQGSKSYQEAGRDGQMGHIRNQDDVCQ